MRSATLGAPAVLLLGLLGACGSDAGESAAVATPAGSEQPVVTLHSRPDAPAPACTGLDVALPASGKAAPRKRALPDLELGCIDGGAGLNLANVRGPALVNVWASWCGPCAAEMPHLVAVEAAVRKQVRFVGLNISDDPADARTWNAYHQVTWPSLRDASGKSRARLRFAGPPVTFFVRPDGGIAGVHYGAFTSTEQVREALATYLGIESGTSSEAPA
jgi:thiol-disulfide isomerase/thioredoxin